MKTENNNLIKMHIGNVLINIFVVLFSGAILQTLLIERGISEEKVNIYVSVMQIVQTLTMLLLSKKMDEVKNVIRLYASVLFGVVPLALFLIFLSFNGEIFKDKTILVLFLTGGIFNFFYSINFVISYKVPYHVMNMENYGKFTAVSGVVISVATLLLTAMISFFQNNFDYFKVMLYVYVFSLLLVVAYFFVTVALKRVNSNSVPEKEGNKINIFTYKPFYSTLLPNFLRGFCAGIVGIIVTIGFYEKILDARSASYLVIITNAVSIAGCLMYSLFAAKKAEMGLLLFSSIGVFAFLPLMFVGKATVVFLGVYGVMYLFYTFINYSVPVIITRIVDYEVMGQYTAWRLLVNAAATALAGFLCIPLIKLFGVIPAMAISGGMQLVSGVWYYIYVKNVTKEQYYELD